MVNSPLIRPYFLGGGGTGGVPLGSHENTSQGSPIQNFNYNATGRLEVIRLRWCLECVVSHIAINQWRLVFLLPPKFKNILATCLIGNHHVHPKHSEGKMLTTHRMSSVLPIIFGRGTPKKQCEFRSNSAKRPKQSICFGLKHGQTTFHPNLKNKSTNKHLNSGAFCSNKKWC